MNTDSLMTVMIMSKRVKMHVRSKYKTKIGKTSEKI